MENARTALHRYISYSESLLYNYLLQSSIIVFESFSDKPRLFFDSLFVIYIALDFMINDSQ